MTSLPRALGPSTNMIYRGVPGAHPLYLLLILILLPGLLGTGEILYIDMDVSNFPNLSISSINCNSLNMSGVGSLNHKLKIYGITRLRADIIFLSDIRMNSIQNVSCIPQVKNSFRINPYAGYDFYYNSSMNKRGVGILLKKTNSFRIVEEWRDPAENVLLLKLILEGNHTPFIIGSIYGPNRYEPAFFDFLRTTLSGTGNIPVILGGDWNCSPSAAPARENPDVLNMNMIPNKRHSDLLKNCVMIWSYSNRTVLDILTSLTILIYPRIR